MGESGWDFACEVIDTTRKLGGGAAGQEDVLNRLSGSVDGWVWVRHGDRG